QLTSQILGSAQRAQRRGTQQWRRRRIRAEEAGGDRAHHAVDDEVVYRDVVAAEAPAPGRRTAGLAEDPQVIQAGVAAPFAAPVDGPALDLIEDVVQPDNRGDGYVPGGGQPAGDQLVSTALLGGPLVRQGQAAVV